MTDRLQDLRARWDNTATDVAGAGSDDGSDVEMGVIGENSGLYNPEALVGVFFEDVEELKAVMEEIRGQMNRLHDIYSRYLVATSGEEEATLSDQLQDTLDDINSQAQGVREKLKEIKVQNAEFEVAHPGDVGLQEVRNNMHVNITKRFLDLMNEYQALQARYKAKIRDRIERQVRLVDPSVPDEMIEQILEEGGSPQAFAQQMLDNKTRQDAKNALVYIKEQHSDIRRIEASIVELHQLFIDMNILVEAQGELLDQIEYSVDAARAYTAATVDNLELAEKYAKSKRKKVLIAVVLFTVFTVVFCCLFCLLIVILAIILIVVSGGGTVLVSVAGTVIGVVVALIQDN